MILRGHNATRTGQDWAIVQAGVGQVAQLDLRALWTSQGNNLRVYVDGGEETSTVRLYINATDCFHCR